MKRISYVLMLLNLILLQTNVYSMQEEHNKKSRQEFNKKILFEGLPGSSSRGLLQQYFEEPNGKTLRLILELLEDLGDEEAMLKTIELVQGALAPYSDESKEVQEADKLIADFYNKQVRREKDKIMELEAEIRKMQEEAEEGNIEREEILDLKDEHAKLLALKEDLLKDLEKVNNEQNSLREVLRQKEHELELRKKLVSQEEDPELENKRLMAEKTKLLEKIAELKNLLERK